MRLRPAYSSYIFVPESNNKTKLPVTFLKNMHLIKQEPKTVKPLQNEKVNLSAGNDTHNGTDQRLR
jgi:hypothetical protein